MLNAYMIYSRGAGPQEGAALVFAHSVREARRVGWRSVGSDFTDDYLDLAANQIRKEPWLFEEADAIKFANDEPHVIGNPRTCSRCGLWGLGPISEDRLCPDCESEVM